LACAALLYLIAWTAERVKHPEIMEMSSRCLEEYKRLLEIKKGRGP
jgi:hypothetical protein